jgi:MoxR-like ATPase
MASIEKIDKYIEIANELKLNLALVGAHGRAKTAYVQQYARDNGYILITKILAQMEPSDLLGLPRTEVLEDGSSITAVSHPDWLVAACDPNKKVILFFDEFNNAENDVQASILNLIEDRASNGMRLSDTTQIILACNPPAIAPNARRLAKATRDRICMIPVSDNSDPYEKYYVNNGMSVLADVLAEVPDLVPDYSEKTKQYAYENAEFTYRSLEKAYRIVEYALEHDVPEPIYTEMVSGYGGNYGTSLARNLKEKITAVNATSEVDEILEKKDLDSLLDYYYKHQDIYCKQGYAALFAFARKVDRALGKEDFNKFAKQVFTPEFTKAYYEEKRSFEE